MPVRKPLARLTFSLDLSEVDRRLLRVTLEADRGLWGSGEEVDLWFPAWTPGSYLIRDYARHVGALSAIDTVGRNPIAVEKVSKNRIRLEAGDGAGPLRLTYTVYCHEFTVRTADFSGERAF